MDVSVEGGFADAVLGAQAVFRAIMEALSRPGTPRALAHDATPPAPLSRDLGVVALTLCDHDSPVWLDPALAATQSVAQWLRFQTGAPLVTEPARVLFALVGDPNHLPPLGDFAQGSDEYPDRSTTLVLASGAPARALRLTGPGVKGELIARLPLPSGDFVAQWAENRARFPRGVDLLLVGDGMVTGLPRTTRIAEA